MPRRFEEPTLIRKYEPDMDRMVAALMIALGIDRRTVDAYLWERKHAAGKPDRKKAVNE